MVLEAFAAISLAGNIVQFVDFTSKLVTQSSKLYKSHSEALAENAELQVVAEDLKSLSGSLTVGFFATLEANEGTVTELPSSLRARVEERVEEFQANIGRFQTQLILHLVKLMSDQQSSVARGVWALSQASTQMNMNKSAQLEHLKSAIEEFKQTTYEKVRGDGVAASGTWAIAESSTQMSVNIPRQLQQLEFTECMQGQGRCETPGVKQLSAKLKNVVTTRSAVAAGQEILRSLQFKSMRMRQSNIAKAHRKTFDGLQAFNKQ